MDSEKRAKIKENGIPLETNQDDGRTLEELGAEGGQKYLRWDECSELDSFGERVRKWIVDWFEWTAGGRERERGAGRMKGGEEVRRLRRDTGNK